MGLAYSFRGSVCLVFLLGSIPQLPDNSQVCLAYYKRHCLALLTLLRSLFLLSLPRPHVCRFSGPGFSLLICLCVSLSSFPNSSPHALNKFYSILYLLYGLSLRGKGCLSMGPQRYPLPHHHTVLLPNISLKLFLFYKTQHETQICKFTDCASSYPPPPPPHMAFPAIGSIKLHPNSGELVSFPYSRSCFRTSTLR